MSAAVGMLCMIGEEHLEDCAEYVWSWATQIAQQVYQHATIIQSCFSAN
jgi:hypothetical protein